MLKSAAPQLVPRPRAKFSSRLLKKFTSLAVNDVLLTTCVSDVNTDLDDDYIRFIWYHKCGTKALLIQIMI